MSIMAQRLDGQLLRKMLAGGARFVAREAQRIDRMNVFPVPDGDTGTNLAATLARMEEEMNATANGSARSAADAAAKGALLGARGNSGVIFSQILKGFADGIETASDVSTGGFARAMVLAADRAYQAVIRPVEGTILTVVNDASAAAALSAVEHEEIEPVLADALDQARLTLARTPQMLEKLRQAGVVDAGGQGFVCFLEGMLAAVRGEIDLSAAKAEETVADTSLLYRYCTEVAVAAVAASAEEFRKSFAEGNDSLIVAADGGVVKIHVHTNDPASILNAAQAAGELIDVKVENMARQHTERYVPAQCIGPVASAATAAPPAGPAVVAVVAGEGMKKIFRGLGATVIVDGGQSMNPSTEMILDALKEAPGEPVFVLPNNPNIALAAKRAAELDARDVRVVSTETMPQGLAALVEMEGAGGAEETFERMRRAAEETVSVEVTRAVRDAVMDGLSVRQGDAICIVDGLLLIGEADLTEALRRVTALLAERNVEVATFFSGAGVTDEQARGYVDALSKEFQSLRFELHQGGQPHYEFIIWAE